MDLEPFLRINTCGSDSLQVTQLSNFQDITFDQVQKSFESILLDKLQTSILK